MQCPFAKFELKIIDILNDIHEDGVTSLHTIARTAVIDVQSIYKLRDGRRGLSPPNMERLAAAIGYTIAVLPAEGQS